MGSIHWTTSESSCKNTTTTGPPVLICCSNSSISATVQDTKSRINKVNLEGGHNCPVHKTPSHVVTVHSVWGSLYNKPSCTTSKLAQDKVVTVQTSFHKATKTCFSVRLYCKINPFKKRFSVFPSTRHTRKVHSTTKSVSKWRMFYCKDSSLTKTSNIAIAKKQQVGWRNNFLVLLRFKWRIASIISPADYFLFNL